MLRILIGDTVFKIISSISLIVIFSAVAFLSTSLVFGNSREQTQSIVILAGIIVAVVVVLFAWKRLKKSI
jgi:hypothetical protein